MKLCYNTLTWLILWSNPIGYKKKDRWKRNQNPNIELEEGRKPNKKTREMFLLRKVKNHCSNFIFKVELKF